MNFCMYSCIFDEKNYYCKQKGSIKMCTNLYCTQHGENNRVLAKHKILAKCAKYKYLYHISWNPSIIKWDPIAEMAQKTFREKLFYRFKPCVLMRFEHWHPHAEY